MKYASSSGPVARAAAARTSHAQPETHSTAAVRAGADTNRPGQPKRSSNHECAHSRSGVGNAPTVASRAPVSVITAGPTSPASGWRSSTSASASSPPGGTSTSGLITARNGVVAAAIPAFTPAAKPRFAGRRTTWASPSRVAARSAVPSVLALSATTMRTPRRGAAARSAAMQRSSTARDSYVTTMAVIEPSEGDGGTDTGATLATAARQRQRPWAAHRTTAGALCSSTHTDRPSSAVAAESNRAANGSTRRYCSIRSGLVSRCVTPARCM